MSSCHLILPVSSPPIPARAPFVCGVVPLRHRAARPPRRAAFGLFCWYNGTSAGLGRGWRSAVRVLPPPNLTCHAAGHLFCRVLMSPPAAAAAAAPMLLCKATVAWPRTVSLARAAPVSSTPRLKGARHLGVALAQRVAPAVKAQPTEAAVVPAHVVGRGRLGAPLPCALAPRAAGAPHARREHRPGVQDRVGRGVAADLLALADFVFLGAAGRAPPRARGGYRARQAARGRQEPVLHRRKQLCVLRGRMRLARHRPAQQAALAASARRYRREHAAASARTLRAHCCCRVRVRLGVGSALRAVHRRFALLRRHVDYLRQRLQHRVAPRGPQHRAGGGRHRGGRAN
mmetsp:Transcript_1736/g.5024  ORF Transcript_1736/g.5024 Transcript_1736/m.5024 type:complete len:345 (-) Transcript_1736:850-1884(-)